MYKNNTTNVWGYSIYKIIISIYIMSHIKYICIKEREHYAYVLDSRYIYSLNIYDGKKKQFFYKHNF